MGVNTFYHTGKLVRFTLKRERIMSSVWIICLAAFSIILAAGMGTMFDDAARQALAVTLDNPGIVSMMGPVYGAENYTVGAMYANTMFIWVAIAVALMNVFLIVRHTRGDEENGCREITASLSVGRSANLTAAMVTAVIVNMIIGIVHFVGIAVLNVKAMDITGCLIYSASLVAFGILFAGITAVFCQLSATSRGAIGLSLGMLGVFYMLRAAGDIGNETLSYISPMGLMQRSKPFTENVAYPIFVLLLESFLFTAIAFILNSKRDIGQGFIPAKPGKKYASKALRSPFGLTFRLLRSTSLIWLIVMFIFAAAYGSILGDIETFVSKSEFYQMMMGIDGEYSVPMMFVSMVNTIMSLLCTVPVVTAILKLNKEEKAGRLDYVLSRPVSKTKYLGCFTAIAFVASILMQLATAFGLYASACAVLEEKIVLAFFVKSTIVYLPALWVMIGVTVLLLGAIPKLIDAVWAYFGFSFFVVFIGRALELPDWLTALTPFSYVPQLPKDELEALPLVVLTMVAVILTAIGFVFYGKRDKTA